MMKLSGEFNQAINLFFVGWMTFISIDLLITHQKRHLAMSYSSAHPRMSDPSQPSCDDVASSFSKQGGITNGSLSH